MAKTVDYDVAIIGSGFGGSVAALRLTEKGYRVGVLEAGRRFADDEYAKTSWRMNKFVWAPKLGCFGIQRIHYLPDCIILAGAGVGGGSLVYANTLYVPPSDFFTDKAWAHITDWEDELSPYYDQAGRMLGRITNPTMTPTDVAIKQVATEMGVGDTFKLADVGVYFGDEQGKTVKDPFFGGVGPERTGCIECGECMTGCRHGSKNTLDKNYLALAEKAGAMIHPLTTVVSIEQDAKSGKWLVTTEKSGAWIRKQKTVFRADHVVMAAGAFNTQKLLHFMKAMGKLPKVSDTIGKLSRSNSESLVGAVSLNNDVRYNEGVAITSSFYPEPETHFEPVRYGHGSNAMALMGTALTDEEPGVPRWKTWARTVAADPINVLRAINPKGQSDRAIIGLVMQSVDNSLTVSVKRVMGRLTLTSGAGEGPPNPTWIPSANEAVRRLSKNIGGLPSGNLGDLISAPMTAHFVGGAVIADSPSHGVIDPYHRVYGYPTMHITDGSAISANLGVNPSLTITAQAERALSMWPNKGEADTRPVQGAQYQRIAPVEPKHPVVPPSAPAALRLPIVSVNGN